MKRRENMKSLVKESQNQKAPCQKEHGEYLRPRTDSVIFHLKSTLSINIHKYIFVSLCYTGQGNWVSV